MLKSASKVTINTGNVLNLIDIKKKAGQNVTEEVVNVNGRRLVRSRLDSEDCVGWFKVVNVNGRRLVRSRLDSEDCVGWFKYNNAFRAVMGLSLYCSASGMFAQAGTACFHSTMRVRAASLVQRVRASPNVVLALSESIKLTLSEWGSQNGFKIQNGSQEPDTSHDSDYAVQSSVVADSSSEVVVNITRPHDDVQMKMAEEERKNLKIGVKIFINEDSTSALSECLESVITALHTTVIDNVILAYNPDVPPKEQTEPVTVYSNKASPISLSNNVGAKVTETEGDNEADARKCEAILPGIKVLWGVLEDYVKNGRVNQLGVADVGGGCLYKLYAWAKVKPTIAQINLASCCVVPPELHAFCRANDVQLLTHADPPDLLSLAAVKTLSDLGVACDNLDWCARYQVHIKCRGVLALKGYVCKATLGKKVK